MKQTIFNHRQLFRQKAMGKKTYEKKFFLMTVTIMFVLSLVLLTVSFAANVLAQEYSPRKPFPKSQIRALPVHGGPKAKSTQGQYRLIVKFRDDLKVRERKGRLVLKDDSGMKKISKVTQRFGMTFSRLAKLPEEKLKKMEDRAAKHSKKAQPDFAGIMIVHMKDTSPEKLEEAGNALQALDEVEFSYIEKLNVPPPGDIPPPTPSYLNMQKSYRGPNPGMNVDYAWSLGYKGKGIKISDCECGWIATHEDLRDINLNLEPGQTIHPDVMNNGWDEHGTAVIGMTSGVINNYGISGMSPGATIYTYPTMTESTHPDMIGLVEYRRFTAIVNAIANSSLGDVVLLEMQTEPPDKTGTEAYVPAEFDYSVWLAVKAGTDAGVIVVAAAGNGKQDLDSEYYDDYRKRGDSGAIIVGAGSSDLNHDKLDISTFGSRVNLQGWGESVFTLGYGDFVQHGGDKNQYYTDSFSGTSSASAFIASACAIVQQAAKERLGHVLTPLKMRDLLIRTGVSQGNGGHIGPFPDLKAAIGSLILPPSSPSALGIKIVP